MLLTAVPMAPDELSTFSKAGETRSRSATAPSAPRIGSMRATSLISVSASCSRVIAGWDFHPKACRRNRALKRHACPSVFGMFDVRILRGPTSYSWAHEENAPALS